MDKTAEKKTLDCVDVVTPTTPVFMAASEILSVLVFLGGCMVLLGWALDIQTFKSVVPGFVSMKANTALCFVFLGTSLWLLQIKRRENNLCQRIALVCGFIVFGTGLLSLLEFMFGWDLGIDQFLFKDLSGDVQTPYLGGMAFNTAINFTIIGAALFLLASKTKNRCLITQVLIILEGVLPFLAFVGYLYNAPPLFIGPFSTSMTLLTAVLFLFVFFGVLFCRPGCGLMQLVSSDAVGGKLVRRLSPITILVPVTLGWVKIQGEKSGLISNEFGVSFVAIADLFFLTSSVAILSFWLNKLDLGRKRAEAQFLQTQKMESVGLLAGGIAHDFNNLLTVINGYSGMQISRRAPGDAVRADFEEILKAGKRAAGLVKQLLIFSRKHVVQPKVINLNSLIQDMGKMFRCVIPENIEIVTLTSPDAWVVKVDPESFHQVLANLAVNASHAMPSGGKLVIETKNIVLDSEYVKQHQDVLEGEYLLLTVSDTGTGMSDEVKAHLFEPFFTTKEKGKGTGLGLSTVFGIVKQSGGYIQIYSELGHGTSFKIYVPRVKGQARTWYDAEDSKPLPRGTETVLFVEDDEAVRNFGVSVLRKQGYEVLEAPTGELALDVTEKHRDKKMPVLITDFVMPGMSGQELAAKLKARRPGIRVLFTSGYTENVSVRSGNLDKDETFLQKPYSPRALAYKIREVLDH